MSARIPFALVGVLLLVGSASYVGSLQAPTVSEPAVDDALDQTAAETQSAFRDAVTTAATETARNPVTIRANTEAGRVLNRSGTLRDSLRLRVYLTARDKLRRLGGSRDDINVTATLSSTETADDLRTAKRRVSVSRTGSDGARLRATVEDITLTARRDGTVVGKRTLSPTVTVPVPTLLVHDRVDAFERRLNAGPDQSGLGGKLTARLYALAWTRGYAQFYGTPIENVVANRHLSVLTNGAVLSMQREHFGHSDQTGRSMLGWAMAHTAFTDILKDSDNTVANTLSNNYDNANLGTLPAAELEETQQSIAGASPEETTTIGINKTADRAFLDTLRALDRTIRQPYAVDVERRTTVEHRGTTVEQPRQPGANWTLADTDTETTVTVERRSGSRPTVDGEWHTLTYYPRLVTNTTTITRTWLRQNETTTTVERHETRHAVDITLVGRHDNGRAPDRGFETIHERGGPLDGPNLADIRSNARTQLILSDGGADTLARRALSTGGGTATASLDGNRPNDLKQWAYDDLQQLHSRVRNISITVPKGKLATLQVNPAKRLSNRLDDRRETLRDVPGTYDGVAGRARIAVRASYLDAVSTRLTARAATHDTRRGKLDDELENEDVSLDSLRSDYRHRNEASSQSPLGGVQMRVQASPSYLTLDALHGEDIPGIPEGQTEHPLAVRNVNVFTVPYGDVADKITSAIFGPKRTRLRTAAQVLRVADEYDRLETEKLRSNVRAATEYLRLSARVELASLGLGTPNERVSVIDQALSRWDSPGARAMAMTNGSGAWAIHDVATEQWDLSDRRSDELAVNLRLQLALERTTKYARPKQPPVDELNKNLRQIAKDRVSGFLGDKAKKAVKKGVETVTGGSFSRLPAGLPLTPLPGFWYLTINYWEVQVRGEYARFAISVPRGTPEQPGGRLLYVRDGEPVTLDVDGDGTKERLGRAGRVSFRTHTSVAVAVPPGASGVGDVDGQMDERSPGWPNPGS